MSTFSQWLQAVEWMGTSKSGILNQGNSSRALMEDRVRSIATLPSASPPPQTTTNKQTNIEEEGGIRQTIYEKNACLTKRGGT